MGKLSTSSKSGSFWRVEGYVMFVPQLKEGIGKESIYHICKNQSQNSAFQRSENLNFKISSPDPPMMGP